MSHRLRRLSAAALLALAAVLTSVTSTAQTGVTWTSLVNATTSGSGLTPTAAGGRGESSQSVPTGNGSLKVVAWSSGDGSYTQFGLANGAFTGSGSEIDYGWLTYGTVANCRKDGSSLNGLINIANGDTLEVRINGTTVEYYHNTTLVWSLTNQTLSYPYRGVAFFSAATSPPISSATMTGMDNLVAPTSLAAANGAGNNINLSWAYTGTGQAGFKIERKLGRNGTYTQIATVGAAARTYADTGTKTANRVYAYRVRAYKTGADGPYSAFVQATTPYTGSGSFKTDRAVYAEPALPPLPHAGGKWRDEVFGTEIMRATDEDDFPSPGVSTFYSHWPTFNADNTRMLVRVGNGDAILKDFDPVNFKVGAKSALPRLPGGFSVNWEGATWSNTDPNIIYCHPSYYDGGMKLYKYDVRVGTSAGFTQMYDFSSYNEGNDLLRQMYVSGDDKVFCFLHVRAGLNDGGPAYYFVYRHLPTPAVLYHNPASAYAGGINEVHVDKTGKWLSIALNQDQPDGTRTRYLNIATGAVEAIQQNGIERPGGHGDIGTARDAGFDRWGDGVQVRQYTDLHNPFTTYLYHTAAGQADWTQDFHGSLLSNNEDWLTIGTYDDKDIRDLPDYGIFEDEIAQVTLDGSHRIRRIAHTRSNIAADAPVAGEITPSDSNGYWAMPKPTISKDGRFIAFNSNWENSGRYDVFVLRVPRAPFLALQDDFNDNSRDVKKWTVALLGSAVSDPNVPVVEQNQRLEMTPLTGATGGHSNGYSTATVIDMTNKRASVEVVQATNAASWANTVLSLATDNGWYRFLTEHGLLYMEQNINGSITGATPIAYSPTQHRHWRIRHDGFSDTVYWETSPDGVTWTARHSGPRQLTITSMVADLYVRTWQPESSPGMAVFDNFKFESNPFVARDFGYVGLPGSTTATTAGVYTFNAAGGGIWYENDAFRFMYRKMTGNGQIVARVASLQNALPGAKAGVMIRERLANTSRHASMFLAGDGTADFRRRLNEDCNVNCDTTSTTAAGVSAPQWVKLVRSANTFSGYRSSDGVNWQLVGTQTISMGTSVYVGLAVTNQSTTASCTATFDNLSAPGPQ
ncbi:MAG TPA: hypothetical protein VG148_18070 [Pyrinomonadaceae bacterium]|nr:hypothetical protein [Pyrinomonadaceae bacterium]